MSKIEVETYNKNKIDSLLEEKQDSLTTDQLSAVNSGITSSLVASLQELLDNGNAENLEV